MIPFIDTCNNCYQYFLSMLINCQFQKSGTNRNALQFCTIFADFNFTSSIALLSARLCVGVICVYKIKKKCIILCLLAYIKDLRSDGEERRTFVVQLFPLDTLRTWIGKCASNCSVLYVTGRSRIVECVFAVYNFMN